MEDIRWRSVPMSDVIRDFLLDKLEDSGRKNPNINLKMQNLGHSGMLVIGEALNGEVRGRHIQYGARMHSAQNVSRLGHTWNIWEVVRICANNFDVVGTGLRKSKGGNACPVITRV
jgi:hypothetical protein